MPYRCPVCDAEQADGVHLANHLAVTASLGRTAHVEWLAEHAPDWTSRGPDDLAAVVVEFAEPVETDDDATGSAPSVEAGLAESARRPDRGELTAEAESVLERARELTRRMHAEGDEAPPPGESAEASTGEPAGDADGSATGDAEDESASDADDGTTGDADDGTTGDAEDGTAGDDESAIGDENG